MKRIILALMVFSLIPLSALQNWLIYTNTDYVFDMEYSNEKLYVATWGGLLEYESQTDLLIRQYTKNEGLSDLDLRTLENISGEDVLFIGTERSGIDRLVQGDFLSQVDESIGLISNTVHDITHNDSLIFVATDAGVSIFNQTTDFPFPFLYENIDLDNGLSVNDISTLAVNENYLFCGSRQGIDYAHLDSLRIPTSWHNLKTLNSPLPDDVVNSISTTQDKVAFATGAGIALFNQDLSELITIYDESNLIEAGSILSVYFDEAGDLWFSYGIWDDNLLRIIYDGNIAVSRLDQQDELTTWTKDDLGLEFPYIKGMKQLNDNIYAFGWGEGYLKYNDFGWTGPIKQNCLISNIVTGLHMDQNNTLWVNNGHKGYLATNKGTKGISSFDGNSWVNYTFLNSGLHNNNIFSVAVDQENRKWFGAWNSNSDFGWLGGVSIFDDNSGDWSYLDSNDGILNNTISFITAHNDYKWVCSYGGTSGGVNIIDQNDELYYTFDVYEHPNVDTLYDPNFIFFGEERMYLGCYITGLRIWDSNSMPYTDGPYWELTPFSDLYSGRINDIKASYRIDNQTDEEIEEIWIASTSGLFRYTWSTYFNSSGEYLWYKFGTDIKRKAFVNNQWFDEADPEFWYIEGQERLYGSIPTFPTALFVDPFNNVWIGTNDNGITYYEQQSDTYTIYNSENTPLQSNKITSFAYDQYKGYLYIGTDSGLHRFNIGIAADLNEEENLNKTQVYPNPFYPEIDQTVRIINKDALTMPKGKTVCNIYDLSGELIIELPKNKFELFDWDGRNSEGKKCSSGIYFYVISTPNGEISKGKIVLIR